MSLFERVRGRVRRVETRRGDTLQKVAARELGNASRWSELAGINDLLPPYLTDDPAAVSAKVMLTGSPILVPDLGTTALAQPAPNPEAVFGRDISNRGQAGMRGLALVDGDIATIGGNDNFVQAITNRLETRLRELTFHPSYGNGAFDLIGRAASAINASLIERAVAADPRVARMEGVTAEIRADVIRITGTAVAVDGSTAPLETVSGV